MKLTCGLVGEFWLWVLVLVVIQLDTNSKSWPTNRHYCSERLIFEPYFTEIHCTARWTARIPKYILRYSRKPDSKIQLKYPSRTRPFFQITLEITRPEPLHIKVYSSCKSRIECMIAYSTLGYSSVNTIFLLWWSVYILNKNRSIRIDSYQTFHTLVAEKCPKLQVGVFSPIDTSRYIS